MSVRNALHEIEYVWNLATCNCENGKCLTSIVDDSAITCNEIMQSYFEETKLFQKISVKRKKPAKHKSSISYLYFL